MKTSDLTVEILKDIRQELRELRADTTAGLQKLGDRLDARIDETNERLDETNARLVASEMRMATAITTLAGDVHELTAFLRVQGDLRPRVERCERDIADLQDKLRPAS